MTKYNLLGATALQTSALILFAAATPAFAQTTDAQTQVVPPATSPDAQVSGTVIKGGTVKPAEQSIVVTGSRIRSPNLESAAPVTTITGEQLFETGKVQVGDQLNDLPQLRSTFST